MAGQEQVVRTGAAEMGLLSALAMLCKSGQLLMACQLGSAPGRGLECRRPSQLRWNRGEEKMCLLTVMLVLARLHRSWHRAGTQQHSRRRPST
jgi:hypothetical protein